MLGLRSVLPDPPPALPHQCPPDDRPCCPVCYGVLQPHAHHPRATVSAEDQPTHGQPGQWAPAPAGCLCGALVTAVLGTGLQGPSFCLELSLPATIAIRQGVVLGFSTHCVQTRHAASLSAWLEQQLGREVWPHAQRVVEVCTPKEAVREALEHAVERATGMTRTAGWWAHCLLARCTMCACRMALW